MKWKLIWPIVLTLLIPLAVAWFVYPETHLPPGFGVFPPQEIPGTPGFNLWVFLLVGAFCLFITAFLVFPKRFGFKADTPPVPAAKKPLPWWFYLGTVMMVFFWWLEWSHSMAFGNLVYWAFAPMWYGFILILDGLVYHRNNGVSLLSSKPKTFLLAAIVSTGGWVYFEYYDYFVLANWYYPDAHKAPWPQWLLTIEFLITYSTITVVFFEWYTLFKTFPKFAVRYKNGPKWVLNGNTLIGLGALLIGLMVIFPYPLFGIVWIGPFMVMTGILLKLSIQNPFTDVAKGDWTAAILMALASLFNGFVWEFWNHGSIVFNTVTRTNPNLWIYDIPYVNVIHIFSEMPLLGYFGYLPFGILVWQVFIWTGKLFNFDTDIEINQYGK